MPTQDTNNPPPNVTMRQRAREYWWPRGRSVGQNLLNVGGRILQSGLNPAVGVIQTGVHVGRGEAVEGIQRVARERGWDLNPFDNIRDSFRRRRDESPATPAAGEPTFMRQRPRPPQSASAPPPVRASRGPSFFGEGGEPWNSDHTPQTEWELTNSHMRNFWEPGHPASTPPPLPTRLASPTSGAGRMGGTTIARDDAAVAFARGIGHANSGLGASSWGRDRMMMTQREG